jgi:hypothetical protein
MVAATPAGFVTVRMLLEQGELPVRELAQILGFHQDNR